MPILSPQASSNEMLNYWNKIYQGMDSFDKAFSTNVRLEAEKRLLAKYFPDLKGKRILKIDLWDEVKNSGFLIHPAEQEAEIFAIDISNSLTEGALKIFKKRGLAANFVTADMRYLPFKDNYFDLIWSIGTIEHVADPSLAFLEFYRVLKKDGVAIIGCPNRHDPYLSSLVICLGNKLGLLPYGDEMSYSFGKLKRLMQVAGFKIVERTSPYFMPWFIRYPDIFLHLKAKPLDLFIRPIIYPFFFLNKINLLLRYSNHLACVGRKE